MLKFLRILKAALFFLPELLLCALVLVAPEALDKAILGIGKGLFSQCSQCLRAPQFMFSILLVSYCLAAHLARFFILHIYGETTLLLHKATAKELLVCLLIAAAYGIFVIDTIKSIPVQPSEPALNIVDIVSSSVIALSFFVLATFAVSTLFRRYS